MITSFLLLLPASILFPIAQFFFVYSVIFDRAEYNMFSYQSYQIFEYVSDVYAKKLLTPQ